MFKTRRFTDSIHKKFYLYTAHMFVSVTQCPHTPAVLLAVMLQNINFGE